MSNAYNWIIFQCRLFAYQSSDCKILIFLNFLQLFFGFETSTVHPNTRNTWTLQSTGVFLFMLLKWITLVVFYDSRFFQTYKTFTIFLQDIFQLFCGRLLAYHWEFSAHWKSMRMGICRLPGMPGLESFTRIVFNCTFDFKNFLLAFFIFALLKDCFGLQWFSAQSEAIIMQNLWGSRDFPFNTSRQIS